MEILTDIKSNDEQDKIIRDYHITNNHRVIHETFLHLKRGYYFSFMKNKITSSLNICETCNAPVERLQSTLTEIYRIFQHKFNKGNVEADRDDIISEILTYINSIHSATKFTPYELFYARTHSFNINIKYSSKHFRQNYTH